MYYFINRDCQWAINTAEKWIRSLWTLDKGLLNSGASLSWFFARYRIIRTFLGWLGNMGCVTRDAWVARSIARGFSHVLARSPLCQADSRLWQVPVHGSATSRWKLNMAEHSAEQKIKRKVMIAVDGSEHGDRAFDCKFLEYPDLTVRYLFLIF